LSFLVLGRFRPVHRAAILCPAALSVISADRGNARLLHRRNLQCSAGTSVDGSPFREERHAGDSWLALGVAAILHWIGYLEQDQRRSLYLSALWLSAALLFKQTSVYLLVFCVLTLLVTGQGRRIVSRDAVLLAAIIAVLAGPFLTLMLFFLQKERLSRMISAHIG
jgi:hypothetical protein